MIFQHICPVCDKQCQKDAGYGLAAGPMGSYAYCCVCDHLIDYLRDMDGDPEVEQDEAIAAVRERDGAALYYSIECARITYWGRPW